MTKGWAVGTHDVVEVSPSDRSNDVGYKHPPNETEHTVDSARPGQASGTLVDEEGLGNHERHQGLADSDGTSHHEAVSEMLLVVLAVGRQNNREQEHGVGKEVDGPTTDGKCERDKDQVGKTLGEGGHDREVEEVLVVLAFL